LPVDEEIMGSQDEAVDTDEVTSTTTTHVDCRQGNDASRDI